MYIIHFGSIHSSVPAYNLYWTLLTQISLSQPHGCVVIQWFTDNLPVVGHCGEHPLFRLEFLTDFCMSCAGYHSCCEFLCAIVMSSPVASISQHITPPSTSYILLTLYATVCPKPSEVWYGCAFTLAHSQHLEHTKVCVLATTHCQKSLHWPRLETEKVDGYKQKFLYVTI